MNMTNENIGSNFKLVVLLDVSPGVRQNTSFKRADNTAIFTNQSLHQFMRDA